MDQELADQNPQSVNLDWQQAELINYYYNYSTDLKWEKPAVRWQFSSFAYSAVQL